MELQHGKGDSKLCTKAAIYSADDFSINEVKRICENDAGCNLILEKRENSFELSKCPCPVPTPNRTPHNNRTTYYMEC